VGMARHCGPGSWIPRNSGSPLARCPIARAVAGAGLRFVTGILNSAKHVCYFVVFISLCVSLFLTVG